MHNQASLQLYETIYVIEGAINKQIWSEPEQFIPFEELLVDIAIGGEIPRV